MSIRASLILIILLCTNNIFGQSKDFSIAETPFRVKGFHIDLRIQVMKMPALKDFALKLSENGFNTLVMEWEASYPYEKHSVISNRYAYSREEIKSFVAYCNSINIDVIPLQQSFGHVEYILRHYRYKDLREDQEDYSQVNPLKEDLCKALFTDLFADMASTHTSQYIHIGGDETYLLGHSEESKKKVAAVGKGRLYGDYLKILCDIVVGLGKRPVVWADIALKYPDALKLLPKETIFVDWNYGWAIDRFGDHNKLVKGGFEIWGSPSIRSYPDNYFLTEWEKHFKNISTFIPQARELGYQGMIMTSWSTSGIYSPIFETSSDIIDLHAVRRVYPITGFNMLIDAYFKGANSNKALDITGFISQYAQDKYGFSIQEANDFWTALKRAPYEIKQGEIIGSSININQLVDSAKFTATVLNNLKPKSNKTEFEHYRLMADIRLQNVIYMSLEMRTNGPGFNDAEASEILKQLKALDTKKIDKRFITLNKSTFHEAELKQENSLRNVKINLLIQKLSRDKTSWKL